MKVLFWSSVLLWVSIIGVKDVRSQGEITFEEGLHILDRWSNGNADKLLKDRFALVLREDFPSFALSKNVSTSFNVSSQCVSDCETVLSSIAQGEEYALYMLDSWGKPGANILLGNSHWTGSYSECKLSNSFLKNSNNITFNSQYCTVGIGNSSSASPSMLAGNIGFILGMCVPDSCSLLDVRNLINAALSFLPNSPDAAASQIQVYVEDRKLDSSAVGVICMLAVLVAIIICSSAYDIIHSMQSPPQELLLPVANSDSPLQIDHEDNNGEVSEHTPLLKDSPSKATVQSEPGRCKLLMAFSIFKNGYKILNVTSSSESNLSAVHGIRFLSMSWVILGHTYVFILAFAENPAEIVTLAKQFSFQAILNATVSVDTFFVLSGVLAGYLLLRELEVKDGPKRVPWWKYYFHRFWRLTPPYMLVLGTYVSLFYYIGEGPYWPENMDGFCRSNWWTNILYINNLVETQKACFAWSWYLANDMQFFIITPFLVIPLFMPNRIFQIIGWVLNLLVLVGSMIATGVITHKHGYPASTPSLIGDPTMMGGNYMKDVYMAPWCRIGPYIIGLLVGYLLFKTKRVIRLHKVVVVLGWLAAAAMNLAVLYGLYGVTNGHHLSPGVNAFYAAVHRNVWAVGLGWVIFACSTGHGGPVNRLLSWSGLVPLSRLTYMAYLIHPIVIYYSYFSFQGPILLTGMNMMYLFLGHLIVTYGLSFVLSMSFEAPMIALEKVIFP